MEHSLSSLLFLSLISACSILFASSPAAQASSHVASSTLQLQVLHVAKPAPHESVLTWEDRMLQTLSADHDRLQFLSNLAVKKSSAPIASGRQVTQNPTYVVKVNVGTPSQSLLMAMDTSNDAAWMPCNGCVGCGSGPLFDSLESTTYKNLGCQEAQCKQVPNSNCATGTCVFNFTYGSSSIASNLSSDTITLANDPIPGYTFGCIQGNVGNSLLAQGLIGLGRGPLSLLTQTQSLYQSTFSYCLPNFKSPNFTGSLRLGPSSQPRLAKFTPLLKNPRRSSLYYINLIGIKVGRKTVEIPAEALAFSASTGSGTIIDSGTVFTRLVEPAYNAVRDEFRKRVGSGFNVTALGGFDTCYTEAIVAPSITFMFTGMNLTLPAENLLIHSTAGSTTCLAMAAAPMNVNSVLNVIANMQQQNHRILFDVPNSRLGVAREFCT
uniref:Peptidase A1 domain-containing protein n=1 Tax=Kalanchoe fedtschenkoi TaxID=63787 RepID=A0A7N0ZZV7_KALFE